MATVYVDEDYIHQPKATITVEEEAKSAKVTYRNAKGKRFSVMVHKKPNPIGFHAKLPGSRR